MNIPERKERVHGLTSFSDRLRSLEETLSKVGVTPGDSLLSRISNKEKEKKEIQLTKLNENYMLSISENTDTDPNNLVELMLFTINYVRQNQIKICSLCQAKYNPEFECMTVCSLLEMLLGQVYKGEMLMCCVKSLQCIQDIEDDEPKFEQPKRKLSLFKKSNKNKS